MLRSLYGPRSSAAAYKAAPLLWRRMSTAAAGGANGTMSPAKKGESWMLSLTGPNRIGVVRDMFRGVAQFGGNVEESRSATLGAEFAVITRVTVESGNAQAMIDAVRDSFPDHDLNAKPTTSRLQTPSNHKTVKLLLEGPDSNGIVSMLTETLAKVSVNIHDMETEVLSAPFAGYPIFQVQAELTFPEGAMEEVANGIKTVEAKFGMTGTLTED